MKKFGIEYQGFLLRFCTHRNYFNCLFRSTKLRKYAIRSLIWSYGSNIDHYARECEFEILRKKTKQNKKTKKKQENLSAVFLTKEECPKLLSSLGINHPIRKTIPLLNSLAKKRVLQSITVCLVSTILGTDIVWWPGRFQTVSRGQVLVFFYRHIIRMYHMKEKQGGPIPRGLKRWPLKFIKHLANTTCVSLSPAGLTGCCPLNFLYLINLKFWVRAPNGCCILKFRPNQSFVCNFLSTPRCKS